MRRIRKFEGYIEAMKAGWLPVQGLRETVVGYRRKDGKSVPIYFEDVGEILYAMTTVPRWGPWGYEARVGRRRIFARPVYLSGIYNEAAMARGMWDYLFSPQDIRSLLEEAKRVARERYGEIEG